MVDDSELPEESVSVLLPLIDLLNHKPLAKVEWQAGRENVGFLVLEDIAPGEEIANNYGPRNNEQCTLACLILSRVVRLSVDLARG